MFGPIFGLMFGPIFWNQFLEPIFCSFCWGVVSNCIVVVLSLLLSSSVMMSLKVVCFLLLLLSLHSLGFLLSLKFFKFFLKALEARTSFPSTASSTSRKRRSSPWRTATRCDGGCGCFGCVHVGLFLGLDNVLLVPNPFVAKPVAHLIKNRFFVKTIF